MHKAEYCKSHGFICLTKLKLIMGELIWLPCDTTGGGKGLEAVRLLAARFLNHVKLQSSRRFCGAMQVTGKLFPSFVLQSI